MRMKKILCMLVAFIAIAFSAFAYERATCKIANGGGTSIVAEVSGGGHNVVYLNLHNDASTNVNLTVTVTVKNGAGRDAFSTTESKTFLVPPGTTPEKIKLTKVNWNVEPNYVTVSVFGARCDE